MYFILKKRTVIIAMTVLLFALCVPAVIGAFGSNEAVETVAENTNWGLGFKEDGKPPTGNASVADLAKHNAYYIGDTSKNIIYLTFDAGFENGNTEKILDSLKKHNIKATFFLVGNYIETSPELVERMVEEGHTIGNHTYSHPDMSKISDEESFKKELQSLESLYKETTDQELLKIYRPPQGKYCVSNLEMADKLGYKTIFWSLAYVDWYENKQPTKEEAFNKLLKRIHPGAIVLLHSTSKTNGDILDELLTKWEDMGYSFGEIKDLIS